MQGPCLETRYSKNEEGTADNDGFGFKETDRGNFEGSDYVLAKRVTDCAMQAEYSSSNMRT